MSYIRGLGATATKDPWAETAEPGLLGTISSGITSLVEKAASVLGAPPAPTRPTPLTEAEKAKLLGTTTAQIPAAAPAPQKRSMLVPIALAGAIGIGALMLLRKPRANPRRSWSSRRPPIVDRQKGNYWIDGYQVGRMDGFRQCEEELQREISAEVHPRRPNPSRRRRRR